MSAIENHINLNMYHAHEIYEKLDIYIYIHWFEYDQYFEDSFLYSLYQIWTNLFCITSYFFINDLIMIIKKMMIFEYTQIDYIFPSCKLLRILCYTSCDSDNRFKQKRRIWQDTLSRYEISKTHGKYDRENEHYFDESYLDHLSNIL